MILEIVNQHSGDVVTVNVYHRLTEFFGVDPGLVVLGHFVIIQYEGIS